MNLVRITATTQAGYQVSWLIDPARTEPDFIPARHGYPTLARVFQAVRVPALGRYEMHPQLVLADSIEVAA